MLKRGEGKNIEKLVKQPGVEGMAILAGCVK
jgi:hypothetical protein